jgi:hypothetical protein
MSSKGDYDGLGRDSRGGRISSRGIKEGDEEKRSDGEWIDEDGMDSEE